MCKDMSLEQRDQSNDVADDHEAMAFGRLSEITGTIMLETASSGYFH